MFTKKNGGFMMMHPLCSLLLALVGAGVIAGGFLAMRGRWGCFWHPGA